jgi:hypothetical protein
MAHPIFFARDNTNTIELLMGTGISGVTFSGSATNHAYSLRTNNTDRVYITKDGYVGFGTTTPTARIMVAAPSLATSATMTAASAATSFSTLTSMTLNDGDYVVPTTTTAQAHAVTVTRTGTTFTVSPPFTGAVSAETFTIYQPPLNVASGALFVQGSTGYVGVGTTNPAVQFNVSTSSGGSSLAIDAYGSTVGITPQIIGRGARGTQASPSASQAGDKLLFSGGRGYGATKFATAGSSAGMFVLAAENFTDTAQGGHLTFETTPIGSTAASRAERMRIQADGTVGIGTTSPGYKLQVGNAADGSEARANAWNTLSDERLKRDFEIIPQALEKLLSINGYYYYWNRGTDDKRKLGVKAQEVQKVFPEVVSEGKDGFLSVSYNHLVGAVVQAIKELYQRWISSDQELHREIASLKVDNEELKKENGELKKRLDKIEKAIFSKSKN